MTLLPACASEPPQEKQLHHFYKVVMLPVDVPESVLQDEPATASTDDDAPIPVRFAISREELAERIEQSVLRSDVFSAVAPVTREELGTDNADEWVSGAEARARSEAADLILRIRVRSAQVWDLGPNDQAVWSGILWFMIPAPIWTVNDRTYDTNITVQAELFDPADAARPKASVVASSGEQALDLWDRGLDIWVPIIPPPFLEGDAETVSATLSELAIAQLLDQLREQLRTNVIPSLFDMTVALDNGEVVVSAELPTVRKLRSLEIRVDGVTQATWAEIATAQLVRADRSTDDRLAYEARASLGGGEVVRVIAVDEAGGREVRTLKVGVKPTPVEGTR